VRYCTEPAWPWVSDVRTRWLASAVYLLLASVCALAQPRIEVLALFRDAAMLEIDGQEVLLRVGQSRAGVQLLRADAREVSVKYEGREQTLVLSRRVGSRFQEPDVPTVSIPRNRQLQYITSAEINGRRMPVLVDTGANVVALNSQHAAQLNIDYRGRGQSTTVLTASGSVEAWSIRLDRVDIGGIVVENVDATVIEGAAPQTVLLGTSYLQHVQLNERDGILYLSRRL